MRNIGVDTTMLTRIRAWGFSPPAQAVYIAVRQLFERDGSDTHKPDKDAIARELDMNPQSVSRILKKLPSELMTVDALCGDRDVDKVRGNRYVRLSVKDLRRLHDTVDGHRHGGWRTVMVHVHLLTIAVNGSTKRGWKSALAKQMGVSGRYIQRQTATLAAAGLLVPIKTKRGRIVGYEVPPLPRPAENLPPATPPPAPTKQAVMIPVAARPPVPPNMDGLFSLTLKEASDMIDQYPLKTQEDWEVRKQMTDVFNSRKAAIWSLQALLKAMPDLELKYVNLFETKYSKTEIEQLDAFMDAGVAEKELGRPLTDSEKAFYSRRKIWVRDRLGGPKPLTIVTGNEPAVARMFGEGSRPPAELEPVKPLDAATRGEWAGTLIEIWQMAHKSVLGTRAVRTVRTRGAALGLVVMMNEAGWLPVSDTNKEPLKRAVLLAFLTQAKSLSDKAAGGPTVFTMEGLNKAFPYYRDIIEQECTK